MPCNSAWVMKPRAGSTCRSASRSQGRKVIRFCCRSSEIHMSMSATEEPARPSRLSCAPTAGAHPWIRAHAALLLFVLALIVGGRQVFLPGMALGHGNEMAAIARNLAEQGTYGNPFAPAITGP